MTSCLSTKTITGHWWSAAPQMLSLPYANDGVTCGTISYPTSSDMAFHFILSNANAAPWRHRINSPFQPFTPCCLQTRMVNTPSPTTSNTRICENNFSAHLSVESQGVVVGSLAGFGGRIQRNSNSVSSKLWLARLSIHCSVDILSIVGQMRFITTTN